MSPGRGRFTHPTQPRVLTPREAARIQGFPDTYVFDAIEGVDPKKTQLAKWIGDAVPMPLGYAAGLCVLMPLLGTN
jgi:DNA (cytosine-5)-methyltransferase 1